MPAISVLLLRHGQSEWNAARRWQGGADTPLTELGRDQAHVTARRLGELGVTFHGPWTSDLERASETAAIIAAALGLGRPAVDRRLREADAGEWQGLTPDEIERDFPGWLEAHRRPTSFEPYELVVARGLDAVRSIAAATVAEAGHAVVPLVVAHSGLIRSIVRHLGATDTRIPNLGGVWLSVGATTSPIDGPLDVGGIALGDLFDPHGIVVSGVDAPGEDPGDQPDEAHAHGGAQR